MERNVLCLKKLGKVEGVKDLDDAWLNISLEFELKVVAVGVMQIQRNVILVGAEDEEAFAIRSLVDK